MSSLALPCLRARRRRIRPPHPKWVEAVLLCSMYFVFAVVAITYGNPFSLMGEALLIAAFAGQLRSMHAHVRPDMRLLLIGMVMLFAAIPWTVIT